MQDKYVGDLGDFGKYGLLRHITQRTQMPLGVNWHLHPDEEHLNDGKHTAYLERTTANLMRFRDLDPPLYDALEGIVNQGTRSVASIREANVLPPGTRFHEEPLQYPRDMTGPDRRALRKSWQQNALTRLQEAQLVFLDPDNGLSNTSPTARKGPKHCFPQDLLPHVELGQSIIIYHHLGRQGKAWEQIARWKRTIQEELGLGELPQAFRYRRGSARVYLFVMQPEHRDALTAAREMANRTQWSQHFQEA